MRETPRGLKNSRIVAGVDIGKDIKDPPEAVIAHYNVRRARGVGGTAGNAIWAGGLYFIRIATRFSNNHGVAGVKIFTRY